MEAKSPQHKCGDEFFEESVCLQRAADRRLVIPDPVSAEYGVMRDSLLPQMMGSLGRNASHQLETAMLFEIGKVFNVAKTPKGDVPCERESLSLGFVGPVGR